MTRQPRTDIQKMWASDSTSQLRCGVCQQRLRLRRPGSPWRWAPWWLGTLALGTLVAGTLALGTLALGTLALGTLILGTWHWAPWCQAPWHWALSRFLWLAASGVSLTLSSHPRQCEEGARALCEPWHVWGTRRGRQGARPRGPGLWGALARGLPLSQEAAQSPSFCHP